MKGKPADGVSHSDAVSEGDRLECVAYDFGLSRRAFVKTLGAGLFLAVSIPTLPQESESGQRSRNAFLGSGAQNLAARKKAKNCPPRPAAGADRATTVTRPPEQ